MGRFPIPSPGRLATLVIGAAMVGPALAIDPNAPYHEQILQGLTEHPTRDQVLPWEPPVDFRSQLVFNAEAPVPPQCYTDIADGTATAGRHNPCYACHQDHIPGRENKQNDRDLQEAYTFSDVGLTNHWSNLFEDRSARVAAISDAEILDWIDDDNYSALRQRLIDAGFTGWLPDLDNLEEGAAAFDANGLALDGSWWVAFNYKPLPSTFWPTNGSTDDVMIRLAPEFWKKPDGTDSLDVYRANLALVEANIKGVTRIGAQPIDEVAMGQDVNDDDVLETAVTEVVITTNRKHSGTSLGDLNFYVGKAGDGDLPGGGQDIIPSIFPKGTEFLHTVRYVGVEGDGGIVNSRRMKEVRYMKRYLQSRQFQLDHWYQEEALEKEEGNLPTFIDQGHDGLAKDFGWQITGFIEAYDGRLRWNTYEENTFCMGCHSAVGSTIDKTFSFARKVDGAAGWGYIDLKGMPDVPNKNHPAHVETKTEVHTYLERVGGGTEFRSNPELEARFYLADGVTVNTVALASARDVYELITPSRERALALNKAYKVIVEDQDFIFGRDATVTPPTRVLASVDPATAPTLAPEHQHDWNIVLDWDQAPAAGECMYGGDVDFGQLTTAHAMTLAGPDPADNDQVCAGGDVTLAGELEVTLDPAFQPQPGDTFTLVKGASVSGDFATIRLPTFPGGYFTVARTATSLRLVAVADADEDIPLPLPALVALGALLMAITGYRARRP